jgi:hypothetical protein
VWVVEHSREVVACRVKLGLLVNSIINSYQVSECKGKRQVLALNLPEGGNLIPLRHRVEEERVEIGERVTV